MIVLALTSVGQAFAEENQNIQRYAQIRRFDSTISEEAGTCGTVVRSPINPVLQLK